MRQRSADIGAPISARCRVTSCRPCAKPAGAIPCSCSMRWISSRPATRVIRSRHCSRYSIRSRTTPSATTISASLRSVEGVVHRHCQRAGLHSRAAARPHGDHRAHRIHGGGEAADRAALLAPAPTDREWPDRRSSESLRRGAAPGHRGLHARGRRRSLERQIGALLRNAAVSIASGRARACRSTPPKCEESGRAALRKRRGVRTSVPGVATGLAWTPAGGDILFIESSRVKGSGKLILTGQLGDVMKESAQAAVTLVKSQADRLGIDSAALDNCDLHIHVPAGAIPKDGPSAGVAMATSLASLLSQRTVRPDVAMTGEISLRGVVLPVGGIKEKCVAAARAGHPHRDPAGPQSSRSRGHSGERA